MKKILTICLLLCALTACDDTVTSTYSKKYRVMCGFTVVSYAELLAVVNNPGQYGTIRQSGSKILMTSPSSSNSYSMDALSEEFQFGLGGIIVGTDSYGNLRAYDLACPNCDRNYRRLTLLNDGSGTCKCAQCAIVYDLNNDGVIVDKGNGTHSSPRSLYRYPVSFDGTNLRIVN